MRYAKIGPEPHKLGHCSLQNEYTVGESGRKQAGGRIGFVGRNRLPVEDADPRAGHDRCVAEKDSRGLQKRIVVGWSRQRRETT